MFPRKFTHAFLPNEIASKEIMNLQRAALHAMILNHVNQVYVNLLKPSFLFGLLKSMLVVILGRKTVQQSEQKQGVSLPQILVLCIRKLSENYRKMQIRIIGHKNHANTWIFIGFVFLIIFFNSILIKHEY